MSSSVPFLRVTIDSMHMANTSNGLTQFKELHKMSGNDLGMIYMEILYQTGYFS